MGDEVSPRDVQLRDENGEVAEEVEELGWYEWAKSAGSDFLDDRWFNVAIALITAYALFGDDFRLAVLPKSVDETFVVLSFVCFILFALEQLLRCWAKTDFLCGPGSFDDEDGFEDQELEGGEDEDEGARTCLCRYRGYLFGLYFWLDLLAAISIIPEIPFMWTPIEATIAPIFDTSSQTSQTLATTRAVRASRIGSKTGRVIRIVRLARAVKLFKILTARGRYVLEIEDGKVHKESKIGAKLSEVTTARVILGILVMLICLPIMTPALETHMNERFAIESLNRTATVSQSNVTLRRAADLIINKFQFHEIFEGERNILRLNVPRLGGALLDYPDIYSNLRDTTPSLEIDVYKMVNGDNEVVVEAIFNSKPFVKEAAIQGILTTIFAIVCLTLAAMIFAYDAQELVLRPIESMVDVVRRLAENPLSNFSSNDNTGSYETRLLENTIKKMGNLLRVGFGNEGALNIAKRWTLKVHPYRIYLGLNACGKRMNAIIVSVQIKDFYLVNTEIKEDSIVFMNRVAKVVHDCAVTWDGNCTSNHGDCFVLTWKLATNDDPDQHSVGSFMDLDGADRDPNMTRAQGKLRRRTINPTAGQRAAPMSDLVGNAEISVVADKCLIGACKIIASIRRVKRITEYQKKPKILDKKPDFKVAVLVSMHASPCIECAIGSSLKIDPLYITPAVDTAHRLARLGTEYRVPMVISNTMYQFLTDGAKKYCRLMDSIKLHGEDMPLKLYTYDVWNTAASRRLSMSAFAESWDKDDTWQRDKKVLNDEDRRISIMGGAPIKEHHVTRQDYSLDIFDRDSDLVNLRQHINRTFRERFKKGIEKYIAGEWKVAAKTLETCVKASPHIGGDGPSRAVLDFMKKHKYEAPAEWRGYREITNF